VRLRIEEGGFFFFFLFFARAYWPAAVSDLVISNSGSSGGAAADTDPPLCWFIRVSFHLNGLNTNKLSNYTNNGHYTVNADVNF
jgi:hypothetical protein